MLVAWASGFAADKTYSYTFGKAQNADFTSKNQTKKIGGIDWTLASDAKTIITSANPSGQQIGSNNNPVKNATISTTAIPGTIKSITVTAKAASKDAKMSLSVLVNNVQYGNKIDLSRDESNYEFKNNNNLQSGKIEIKFINSASKGGFYIKNITVNYEEGPAETATTLTFPQSAINIEEGNEATFTGQTATLKTGETVLNNAVTYTTNNDAMFEAYEANVGPKTLKAGEYGTAVVTATFAGDATYAASTATYTVNYTEKAKPATTLDFGFATKTANINETFTATATLKAGETAISGAVTYTSSKPEVATVNETTGEVLALTVGTTTITATFVGTSEYKGSTASYDLTVVDPNVKEVSTTFDFKRPELYNYGVTKINGNGGTPAFGDGAGDVMLNKTIVSGDVTITNTNVASFGTRFWNNTDLRVYEKSEHIVSVPEGYKITSISIIPTEDKYKKYKIGENKVGEDWTGSAQTVKIVYTENSRLLSMTVTYTKPSTPTLTLNEKAEDTEDVLLSTESGKVYDVTLTRTLTAKVWNTICLPFDVTAEQVESVLKATGNVKEFDKEDKATATIFFKPATEMKAGVPYLIKPTEDAKTLVFKGVKITECEPKNASGGNYAVCGTFGNHAMKPDGTELFLTTQGKFAVPAPTTNVMRGFRAYFLVPKNTASAALNLSFGEATGIDGVAVDAVKSVKIYNVNGQYVGTNLEALPKGLYVVGGKKVLK